MYDPRHDQLADVLVNYSCSIQPGEKVLIQAYDTPDEFIESLVNSVSKAGGYPVVDFKKEKIQRSILENATAESLEIIQNVEKYRMKQMDAFIGVRGWINPKELSDLPEEKNNLYQSIIFKGVHHDIRVPNTKWVVLRYPTPVMAMMSKMSTVKFEEFYYNVTTKVDYQKMSLLMDPACDFLKKANRVKIIGKDTDLSFSIKEIGAVKCCGLRNIPDGEIYSCPVRNSVNGIISYNTPSTMYGFTFENIRLEFKDGQIIKATANDTERVNRIFDTDEGARYIGEFAMGCNPYITQAIDETLFDEKIAGSFHFTPGNAYDETDNGNRSAVHWDLVCIQTPEYGGGEIWIDDQLIRKDGIFVHEAFTGLNPENMIK